MKLLILSASKGSVLEVNVKGKDQEEAMRSIEELFLNGFDEGL
jgi:phosphotransferase system HPr-like phosphotransfer protein